VDPCCGITAIDASAGLVTAKDAKTGQSFQFRVSDTRLLRSLSLGQKVYADYGAKRAGIAPAEACCGIIAPGQPINGIIAPAAPINGIIAPAAPINGIIAPAAPINGIIAPAAPINGNAVQASQARAAERGRVPAAQAAARDIGRTPGIQGESKGGHKDEIDILSAQANEYDAIVAKSRRIQPKSLSPRDIKQFNARMAPVRSALRSWAAKYDVDFATKSFSRDDVAAGGQSAAASRRPETRPNVVASCPSHVRSGDEDCELIGATVVNGEMICEYHCSESKDLDRQGDSVKVMQKDQ
ncbi:MAG: hypothetical protein ACRDJ9_09510, partial [Dehalococcoidia bacterium]